MDFCDHLYQNHQRILVGGKLTHWGRVMHICYNISIIDAQKHQYVYISTYVISIYKSMYWKHIRKLLEIATLE